MLISDRDIRQEIADGRIVLEPYDESMIQPASVDVRIDRFFRLFDNHKYPHIDPAQPQEDLTRLVEVAPDEPFILHPGEFVLGSTYEKVTLPDDVAARLEGKSSLGRLGLLTHSTAGFIDPGFSGHVTLVTVTVRTRTIRVLGRAAQTEEAQLTHLRTRPQHNRQGGHIRQFQRQRGPTASRSYLNFHQTMIPTES